MMHKIEYIESEEGDWEEIILDGNQFAVGHKLYGDDWVNLIEEITNIKVVRTIIPLEE